MHNGQKRRNAFNRNWMAIAAVFGLFYFNGIASAQPVDARNVREKDLSTAALGYDLLNRNSAKTDDEKLNIEQTKEEFSEIIKERHKRLSDQRRAELETLYALSKMTGYLVNVIGSGCEGPPRLEIMKSGRNKRAVFDLNMKNLQKLFRLSGKLGLKGNAAYPVIS